MFRSDLNHRHMLGGLGLILTGAFFVFSFQMTMAQYLPNDAIGLGRVLNLTGNYLVVVAFWIVLGGLAVVSASWGCALLFTHATHDTNPDDTPALLERGPDWTWLAFAAGLAALLPAAVRLFVLDGAPITDDEGSYLFMARVLSDGQLYAQSVPEPLKLFFDRVQMINDGKWYAQYFIGWPVLLVPSVWLGAPGATNIILSAVTVFPMYDTLRRIAGKPTARLGIVLFVASPFTMLTAATLSSHVSTLLFVLLTWWALARFRDAPAQTRWSLLIATFFSVAFFIRPLAALGLGGPALAIWAYRLVTDGERHGHRGKHALAFVMPAVLFAGAFFAVNTIQNGSPLKVAYVAKYEYSVQNEFRFAGMEPDKDRAIPNLNFQNFRRQSYMLGSAAVRLNFSAFGWPASLLFLLFAGWSRRTRWLWAGLAGFVASHAVAHDPGVDFFGPVHFYELMWPVIGLTAAGLIRLSEWTDAIDRHLATDTSTNTGLWSALVVSIIVAGAGYLPLRVGTIQQLATSISFPQRLVDHQTDEPSVIFATYPFAKACQADPARPLVLWRPTNRPDFDQRVVWANHISVEHDRRLMEYFPERRGWVLFWSDDCKRALVPLDRADPSRVPEANIRGSNRPPDWSTAPEPYNIDQAR